MKAWIRGAGAGGALRAAPVAGPAPANLRPVAAWLLVCAACVVLVLVVGGLTRLAHAGLAIVQWQPVSGVLPPGSAAAWQAAFDQYRATPEFRELFPDMTLEGFRAIYWWEFAHRLLARLTGAVFLLPFLRFLATRRLPRRLAWRLAGIFVLGGLQGALGWFMVASGLVDEPHVSPLRLCAHLGLALLLLGLLLWTAGRLWWDGAPPLPRPAAAAWLAPAVVWLMALTGGLMAGTRAGLAYDTFPTLNGTLLPPDLLRLKPWTRNLLDNPAMVQFVHRAGACIVLVALLAHALALWRAAPADAAAPARWLRGAVLFMLGVLALQIALGIATVLSGVALPLAAAHQAGAVLLFAATIWVGLARRGQRSAASAAVRCQDGTKDGSMTSANVAPMSSVR